MLATGISTRISSDNGNSWLAAGAEAAATYFPPESEATLWLQNPRAGGC